jgi:hypothetical protein
MSNVQAKLELLNQIDSARVIADICGSRIPAGPPGIFRS